MRRLLPVLNLRLALAGVCILPLFVAQAAHAAVIGLGAAPAGTVQMSHLPIWAQVSSVSATLYATDQGVAHAGPPVGPFTFLRVLGASASRLQVTAYDENGAPGLSGWVELASVTPSAPGTDWLVSSRPTTLWRGADSGAAVARSLDTFTPLQQVDGPVQDRIEVRVYRADFGGILDQGWVSVTDTGPALAPRTRVPAPGPDQPLGLGSPSATNQQQAFLDTAAQAARTVTATTGVPASVTVAQAILESDWGRSLLSQSANNYFGIKAMGSVGNDGVVWMPTAEYDDAGQLYQTVSAFRAYKSLTDSMTDHDLMLRALPRYAPAMQAANDPRRFAELLASGGYATDPSYADKLIALMDRYDLYRLDA